MIYSLTVTNPKNESLVLELARPEAAGLYVQNIEGLGPSKAQINSTELVTSDGALFSSARLNQRNIIITLGMLFSPDVESARQRTYKYFPIKKLIKLRVKTDNRDVETTGYVESHEPVIFSNRESTQISIMCTDPFFYETGRSETTFSGTQPTFEFPFSNESLTENLIEFGMIRRDTRAILSYQGDVDTGVLITVHALAEASNITLYNTQTRESMFIDTNRIITMTGRPFGAGDDIIISTVRGNRYVKLLRDGVYTNVFSVLKKNTAWFQISHGENIFAFSAASGEADVFVNFFYRNAYGGI